GDNVPPYTGDFVRIIILISLIDALAGPFWISAQAIGKIKAYNIILTLINLTTLPIAYGLLKMGYSPGAVLLSKFFISAANQCFRYYFINKYLKFNKKEFLSYLISSGIVLFFLIAATVFGRNNIGESLLKAIFVAAILELALILIVYFLGMSIKERKWIFDLVKNKINNRK